MRKKDELNDPKSCLHKADDDERLFILLERDLAFAPTIRFWCQERIKLGLNKPGDAQLVEAETLANEVEAVQLRAKGWTADFTSKGRF